MNSSKLPTTISVITPVLNGGAYIDGCITNVAAQAVPNCEHIIVDGGSTDETIEKVVAASKRFPHIRLIIAPGLNQADSMNKGIEEASGAIIGTLNVDDFYGNGALREVLTEFVGLAAPAFVVGNCRVLGSGDRLLYRCKPSDLRLENLLVGFGADRFPVNPSCYFYHRSLHNKIGMYDNKLDYTLDIDLVIRAVGNGNVKYVNRDWGNFRLIAGTKTYRDYVSSSEGVYRRDRLLRKYWHCVPLLPRIKMVSMYVGYFGVFLINQMAKRVMRPFGKSI